MICLKLIHDPKTQTFTEKMTVVSPRQAVGANELSDAPEVVDEAPMLSSHNIDHTEPPWPLMFRLARKPGEGIEVVHELPHSEQRGQEQFPQGAGISMADEMKQNLVLGGPSNWKEVNRDSEGLIPAVSKHH